MAGDNTFGCLVDGQLRFGGAWGAVIDPATEAQFGRYTVADEAMVTAAVAAAVGAARTWRTAAAGLRQSALRAIATVLVTNRDPLARLLTLEQGKPLREATDEIDACIRIFNRHEERLAAGQDPLAPVRGESFIQTRTPLGVVVAIIPWNTPILLAASKIGIALLTGNVIIVKPAPTTPATTLMLGALIADRIPAGVVQILGDDGSVGPQLVEHHEVHKIAFTGSTVTGRKVLSTGAHTIKRITVELGGNDPAIVLPGANVKTAAAGIFKEAFVNCGQICSAIKRVYAHSEIVGELSDRLAELIRATRVGAGLMPETDVGPVQNRAHFEKSSALCERAVNAGTVVARSEVPTGKGYFLPVTLIADLPSDHELFTQEQFCPVLPIASFESTDEAVSMANDTPYGLTASVWSSDPDEAKDVATRIDAGLVCINAHRRNATGRGIPLCKESGLGWLGGDEAVSEYVQPHLVAL